MIKLNINGKEQSWDGDPDLPLLWFLRDEAGLTGTKFGCGQALCGACTVIVDKEAVRSCITSINDVAWAMIGGIGFVVGPIFGSTLAPGGVGAQVSNSLFNGLARYVALIGGASLILLVLQNQNGTRWRTPR